MSSVHKSGSWLDDWWPALIISIGVFFALLVSMWHPKT